MNDLIYLGNFETSSGDIIVTDPCYPLGTWCQGTIKVKKGTYKAFIKKSVVDKWGERVTHLYIIKEGLKLEDLSFKETNLAIGVDSGQAGFFCSELYLKTLPEKRPLIGRKEYDQKSFIYELENYNDTVLEETFRRLQPNSYTEALIEIREDRAKRLAELKEPVKAENCEKGDDFYEVCCSFTLSNLGAGVDIFGAVSHSGFGDGGYSCFVAEVDNEVVASYIEFIGEGEEEEDDE